MKATENSALGRAGTEKRLRKSMDGGPRKANKTISNKRSIWAPKPKMSKLASNRLPIREIYFGLSDRHNTNISILFSENSFAEMILFWVMLLEKMSNGY